MIFNPECTHFDADFGLSVGDELLLGQTAIDPTPSSKSSNIREESQGLNKKMSQDMKREFASRDELIAYVREQFPQAEAKESHVSATLGGRKAAEKALQQVDPGKYASTRNFLNGAVTRLSPYLRYGVLSLAEVRDSVLEKVRHQEDAFKIVNELGWRDYWQRLYALFLFIKKVR